MFDPDCLDLGLSPESRRSDRFTPAERLTLFALVGGSYALAFGIGYWVGAW